MKYFCSVNIKLTKARKELIYMMHPKIKKIIHGLEGLENLESTDVVVFDSVLELDESGENNVQIIKGKYLSLKSKGIEMIFDRSPSLDTEIVLLYEFDLDLDLLLELKINDYLNNRNSLLTMKQYAQKKAEADGSKSYGRPRGSKSESLKAIKVKELILKESKDFGGSEADITLIKKANVSRKTYYNYKNELKKQFQNKEE